MPDKNKQLTLADLAVDHADYATTSNFYSNDCTAEWADFQKYLEEFKDADPHYNLVWRWDIEEHENKKRGYRMKIFMLNQRKGQYIGHIINRIYEEDVPDLLEYLGWHWKYLTEMWAPVS